MSDQVEIRTLEGAMELLDQWEAAYNKLLRDYRRLEVRCHHAEDSNETFEFALRHLDPFLPDSMQNKLWRAADPMIYAALAEMRLEPEAIAQPELEPELVEYDPFA